MDRDQKAARSEARAVVDARIRSGRYTHEDEAVEAERRLRDDFYWDRIEAREWGDYRRERGWS